MIEAKLAAFLLAQAPVAALVGERVYPLVIPQTAARPAIAYQRISTPKRTKSHGGNEGRVTARIQLTIEGRSYLEALTLSAAIATAAHGYRGMMGAVRVDETEVTNELDGFTPVASADLAPVRRLDLLISYRE